MRFGKWIETLLEEKGIELDEYLDTYRGDEHRALPVAFFVEHIKISSPETREMVKGKLVQIDFKNGDVRHFLAYLGAQLWEEADQYVAVI